MDEFKRIKMSLFLVLLLQSTAVTGQEDFLTVRVGEEVTLPCSGVRDDQGGCNRTGWLVTNSGCTTVELVALGEIVEEARAESDRLRVTENCSLVIKNVTEEDVGRYFWRQFRSGRDEGALVHLSVVTMTEHQNNDEVTLRCSVKASVRCRHTVKWLFGSRDVDEYQEDMKTSKSHYEASVTFLTSRVDYRSGFRLFTCEVTEYKGEVLLFPFSTPSSGLLRLIVVSVGLATLIMIVVAVNIWTRFKEEKTQMEEISVRYDVDDGTVN
ncbi:uncharacterized protein isoform X2 [Notothenia coriiceps]|uniref:Uncharacterized protein isoform X2 n=1 Tax=Notothenia coriiceps TaxID=8208 RepID=A0A6I9NC39_9TELE|nr:PREDICTED: uncharacterized protein LOC104948395 isoform X2 [Notothenia coriiceps]